MSSDFMQWGRSLVCEKFCWDTEALMKADLPCGKECTALMNGGPLPCDTDCE